MVAAGDEARAGAGAAATVESCEEKRRRMREVSRRRTSAAVRDGSPCNGEHGLCRCTTGSLLLPRPVKVDHTHITICKFLLNFCPLHSLFVGVSVHFLERKSASSFTKSSSIHDELQIRVLISLLYCRIYESELTTHAHTSNNSACTIMLRSGSRT
jgi:hypothetical protein